jgi:cell division protein ZapE
VKGPLALYRQRIERGELSADPAQTRAVEALERLYRDLVHANAQRGWRAKVAKLAGQRPSSVRGLYLWAVSAAGKRC